MPYMYSFKPKQWDIDPDSGFLRARVCFLKYGTMAYAPEEIPGAPAGANPVMMLVDMDALCNPEAIRSLEGMPVMVGHEWATTEVEYQQVGSVAGTPYVNGPYLEGFVVITCPEAIQKIQSNELHDISSAYDFAPIMEAGMADGEPYHGRQTQLKYNHVALLPPGRGRGGKDVRVINHKPETGDKGMDVTSVQVVGNLRVRVANEDMVVLTEALQELDGKVEAARVEVQNQMGGDLEAALAKVEELNAQIATMMEEKSGYEGELMALKEQLEQALDPMMMEDSMNQMMEEKDEAADTMVKNAGDMYEDREKAMNELKGLHGDAMRLLVVEKVRAANSMPELTDEQKKDTGFVNGAYNAYVSAKPKEKTKVPGADAVGRVQTQNQGRTEVRERASRVLFGKKE